LSGVWDADDVPQGHRIALRAAVSRPLVPAQDKKDEDKKDAAAGLVFQVYKDKGGDFRFRLKEGDTILAGSGKGYKTKEGVQKIIGIIQKEAAKAKVVEAKEGK
jgi:uncharacterized protein YegP (UPF0339 family)